MVTNPLLGSARGNAGLRSHSAATAAASYTSGRVVPVKNA
jgi:hypothetical protein